MRTILSLNENEVFKYLMNEHNYTTIDFPPYFTFQKILDDTYNQIKNKKLPDFCKKISIPGKKKKEVVYPKDYENVNYKLITNKNGKYDWRLLELIHPVLYVDLIKLICEKDNWNLIKKRFKLFQKNNRIICCSIPLINNKKKYAILNWWEKLEQKAITNSLHFKYMACTDISNCYPSIYTHSIAWALHDESVAKRNKEDTLLGNSIDTKIRNMNYGQTNGIPQGSLIMDLIAEIVLGYADLLLSSKLKSLKIEGYEILRYRDDYKIFSNDNQTVEKILKELTDILGHLNFKLGSNKTQLCDDILDNVLKKDKVYRLQNPIHNDLNVQKQLILIYKFGLLFPNSGSLKTMLSNLYNNKFKDLKKRPNNYDQLISIITNIMLKNPTTYNLCVAILSEIFKFLKENKKQLIVNEIIQKFKNVPNCEYLELTLQRLTVISNKNKEYDCKLCKKIYQNNEIWNSEWLDIPLDESTIIDEDVLNKLSPTLSEEEIVIFTEDTY